MGDVIPVPVWVVVVLIALMALREYFAARRDEAMRDLWRIYRDEQREPGEVPTCVHGYVYPCVICDGSPGSGDTRPRRYIPDYQPTNNLTFDEMAKLGGYEPPAASPVLSPEATTFPAVTTEEKRDG